MSNSNLASVREGTTTLLTCAASVIAMLVLLSLPETASPEWLEPRVQSLHTVLELIAILVSGLVIVAAWHNLNRDKSSNAQVIVIGFIVVMACDVMHVMTYPGMPRFINESSAPQTIFFWLMGRTAELMTLTAVAMNLAIRWSPWASAAAGLTIAGCLIFFASFQLELFPPTFVEGQGVTPFKTIFEYVLTGGIWFWLSSCSGKPRPMPRAN